ncbi:MAG TPA: hypothetical protein VF869_05270 [Jatrophihabitantaceae bacterium]
MVVVGGGAAVRGGEEAARGLIAKAARSALRDAESAVTKDALKRGETRSAKEILGQMEKDLVGDLSHGENAAIDAFAKRSGEAEKLITPRLERIEQAIPGTELAGKEFKLKSADSLRRKVATDVVRDGKTVDESLSGIKDAVRYTFKSSREDYARVSEDAIGKLKEAGFEPVGKLKNTWGNEAGYKGINSVWRDTETGQMVEVQFHSVESLEAKEGTHGIYDFQRLPGLHPVVRDYLEDLQNGIFGMVTKPTGATGINW